MNMGFIIIFLIVFILTGLGGAVILMRKENARANRMMTIIRGQSFLTDKKKSDQHDANKRRAEIAKKLHEDESETTKDKSKKLTIAMMLAQAGVKSSVSKFWIISGIFACIVTLVCIMMQMSPLAIIMIFITAFLGIPRLVIKKMAARRQKKFLEEFPDALEATVRLLKAGMPVSEAILMISKEYPGPVGEEMSIVYDKQRIGIPLHEAALEATRRMPLPEVKMFATGLAIQAQTGASLSEVLINLANVIRARFRLRRKVKALSSEAIASASIIGALPNVVAAGLWVVNPEYLMLLFTTGTGKALLIGAVVWMMVGVLIMKAMINFKI